MTSTTDSNYFSSNRMTQRNTQRQSFTALYSM